MSSPPSPNAGLASGHVLTVASPRFPTPALEPKADDFMPEELEEAGRDLSPAELVWIRALRAALRQPTEFDASPRAVDETLH